MSEKLPVIYSAHHAGSEFGMYDNRVNLTPEQKIRFSDYGTAETVPTNGVLTLRSDYSRGLIDLNRGLNDKHLFPEKDFGKPTPHLIWKEGMEPTGNERNDLIDTVWLPYHSQILAAIEKLDQPGFVIAWDNTAQYTIGKDANEQSVEMRPFILSNNGKQDSTRPDLNSDKSVTCDPEFLLEFGAKFQSALAKRGLPIEIRFNLVFKGGYVAQRYNTLIDTDLPTKHKIQSFQIEYNADITHNKETLKPNAEAIIDLKKSFEEAIANMF